MADETAKNAEKLDGNALSADEAIKRLRAGNAAYLEASVGAGDVSSELVGKLYREGQTPFACVISCADSRVVPEYLFSASLGELFCIRVAGNAVGDLELASALYAVEHLHVPLVVVLGHTHCGAIEAALEVYDNKVPAEGDALAPLAWRVIAGIDGLRGPVEAASANARFGVETLLADPDIHRHVDEGDVKVVAALYRTDTGIVDFLD